MHTPPTRFRWRESTKSVFFAAVILTGLTVGALFGGH